MPKQDGRLPSGWPNPTPQWTRPSWAPDLSGLKHLQRELTPADVAQVEGFLPLYTAEVGFCGNVPLSAAQQNQYWFNNQAERIAYFKAKMRVKGGAPDLTDYDNNDNYFIYNNTSEIRNSGVILISTASRNLDNCNYMFWHDPYFDNPDVERQRWMFAFIDHVEYIAPSSCAVYYSVDVFQTYFMDMWIKPSYIERMTPDDDALFKHTVQEGIDFGPSTVNNSYFIPLENPKSAAAPLTFTEQGEGVFTAGFVQAFWYSTPESDGRAFSNKIWFPLSLRIFNTPGGTVPGIGAETEMRAFFQNTGHQIVAGWIMPFWMTYNQYTWFLGGLDISFAPGGNGGTLAGGYVPKNKKLYCYPYSFLEITNNLGVTMEFRHECWDVGNRSGTNLSIPMRLHGGLALEPIATLMPSGYLGEGPVKTSSLLLPYGEFPAIPWTSDSFNSWFQSNSSRIALSSNTRKAHTWINTIGGGLSGVMSAAGGAKDAIGGALTGDMGKAAEGASQASTGLLSGGMNVANGITDLISQAYEFDAIKEDLTRTADSVGGYNPGGFFNYLEGRMGWAVRLKTLTPEYAYKVDSFFTKRGYKVGAVMTPNLSTRPRGYKYVEAPNIQICVKNDSFERGVPNPAITQMIGHFAHGMTWWTPPAVVAGMEPDDTVGNYGAWMPTLP